jgi:hypothetical protein
MTNKPTAEDSRSLADLDPHLAEVWNYASAEYAKLYPLRSAVICCQTYRSVAFQNSLYAKGRDGKGNVIKPKEVVTRAVGGKSPHNCFLSRAFDIAFILNKKLDGNTENFKLFADIVASKYGETVEWGGICFKHLKFIDRPHFQLKNWKSL